MSYNTAIDRTTLITSITYDLGKAWKERIPMKIAVAAANGKASGKIIAEALKRGHEWWPSDGMNRMTPVLPHI